MRLDFSNERILAVVAHPDDAELLCAGTLARARADGATIGICVIGQGDKGQPPDAVNDLVEQRAREMSEAAAILGAELFRGEVPDGELADTPVQREMLVEIYRRFEPTLVLAHCPEDYHPDHRAASALADAASWFAASPGHRTASTRLAAPPAVWMMDTVNMIGFAPGFFVDVSEHLDVKRRRLACHRSQLERACEVGFASLEELMHRQGSVRGAQAEVAAAEAFRVHSTWKRLRAW